MTITLRERDIKNGNKSLYLDIYEKGERVNIYLDLYLVPEIDQISKTINAATMKKAMKLRSDYLLHPELIPRAKQKQKVSAQFKDIKTLADWIDMFLELNKDRILSKNTIWAYNHVAGIVKEYLDHINRPKLLLREVDKKFARGLVAWMRTSYTNKKYKEEHQMTENSLNQYQTKIISIINRAIREGLIKVNPFYALDKEEMFHEENPVREFLTIDELKRFLTVETNGKETQRAFGFASFTGLRLSDIEELKWKNIYHQGDICFVSTVMEKTEEIVGIPLGKNALRYLPEKPADAHPDDLVFHLPTRTAIHASCKWIAKKAGINKNVSFHTSRHTFATLTLLASGDLKAVSKILGHTSTTVTQVYAKVLMDKKVETVNLLNGALE